MKRSDIISALILGEIFAIFLIFIFKSLGYFFDYLWLLLVVIPPLVLFGLFLTYLIGKKIPAIFQFGKYATVGFANTVIDFGILNLLMWMTGIYSGTWIFVLNSISFFIAVSHSYIWNRYWAFKADKAKIPKQFITFLIVTMSGVIVNGGIVYSLTTFMSPALGLSLAVWANMAKVLATVVALLWNFTGYKLIVFKK